MFLFTCLMWLTLYFYQTTLLKYESQDTYLNLFRALSYPAIKEDV